MWRIILTRFAVSTMPDHSAQQHLRKRQGLQAHFLPPNRSQNIRELLLSLKARNHVAIFDRFYTEEMYSFHVHNLLPEATMILDMQDMHSLRKSRQSIPGDSMLPTIDDASLLRKLSSICRCDLTLVCSPFETDLLKRRYDILEFKLVTAPLFGDLISPEVPCLEYEARCNICFIGGLRHDPNCDAVQKLHRLWPRIRDQLPDKDVNLHIFGAYCPDQLKSQLNNPSAGFLVHGFIDSLEHAIADKRCLVAPIRFGAGMKGKIIDAWRHRTPVVTTSIGMEGLEKDLSKLLFVADTDNDFINAVVSIYTDKGKWKQALAGNECRLEKLSSSGHRRMQDYTRAILWKQSLRSTEYLSRYIETKEWLKAKPS